MAGRGDYGLHAEATRHGPTISEQDRRQFAAYARSLYDDGTPWFSKQGIRRAALEIAEAAKDRKARLISVEGLDGVVVDFEVEIGKMFSSVGPGPDSVVESATLTYRTPDQFEHATCWNPITAYCTFQILLQVRENIPKTLPSQQETEFVLRRNQQAWEASEQRRKLREVLSTTTVKRSVSKLIGFACGTITAQGSLAKRSATQHALLLTLESIFRGEPNTPIPCYAQDPAYTAIDKAVLHAARLTVLDDPMGFVEMDDESIIVSFYPNCPVKEIVTDLAKPALIVWQAAYDHLIKPPTLLCDPEGPRVKKWLLEHCDELLFPADEEHFGNACMYVRRVDQSL